MRVYCFARASLKLVALQIVFFISKCARKFVMASGIVSESLI